MNAQLIHELTVLALAVFVGFEVISKVPTMLHTPLMSGTNAIHGIVIVGAILVVGDSLGGTLSTVFVLAAFVGIEVISKVPTMLHTPLMSGTNAIHGVVIVGAILVAGSHHGALTTVVGTIAVAFGASNVIGGFLVTDRMLEMFRKRPEVDAAEKGGDTG